MRLWVVESRRKAYRAVRRSGKVVVSQRQCWGTWRPVVGVFERLVFTSWSEAVESLRYQRSRRVFQGLWQYRMKPWVREK